MEIVRNDAIIRYGLWVLVTVMLIGCDTVYYETLERFGVEKRDILIDRVDDARDAQHEAKEQFESALEQFIAVTNYDGGALQDRYNELKDAFEDSESRADAVKKRIADVESVSSDLFTEWKKEFEIYKNQDLKRASAAQLRQTQTRYRELIAAMKRAESKLDPVLDAFRDRVLFLKHNLNAQAISSLREDRAMVESDITTLIREMNRSIDEADRFIEEMSRSSG